MDWASPDHSSETAGAAVVGQFEPLVIRPLSETEVCTLRTEPHSGCFLVFRSLFRPTLGWLLFLERFRYGLFPIAVDLEHFGFGAGGLALLCSGIAAFSHKGPVVPNLKLAPYKPDLLAWKCHANLL